MPCPRSSRCRRSWGRSRRSGSDSGAGAWSSGSRSSGSWPWRSSRRSRFRSRSSGGSRWGDSFAAVVAISAGFVALIALPIAIGIAILRYRLYEIDRIVSRTIGWAIVSGVLAAVFVALVVTLQAVLAPVTRESTLAVAASTLVAFGLFQPLRRRVQRSVDRRFDRGRYDGQRMAGAFAERLRSEGDLATIRTSLAAAADDAVRPTSAAVWLSTGDAR